MYKRISSTILLFVFGAAVVFAIVKANPADSNSVQAYAPPAASVVGTQMPEKQAAVKSLKQIFKDKGIDPAKTAIGIVVDKSDHTLGITAGVLIMKTYHVELGEGGQGDKKVSGDHKTPEGSFYITEKSVLSPSDYYLGSRWMELSYPNKEDADRGLKAGIISRKTYDSIVSAINRGVMPPQNTALGGGVGIHGGSTASFGSDWTWGCVGLSSKDVEDFYSYIKVGTKVAISR